MKFIAFKPSVFLISALLSLTIVVVILKLFDAINESGIDLITAVLITCLITVLIDFYQSKKPPLLKITREMPTQLSFNRWHPVKLGVENVGPRTIKFYAREHINKYFEIEGLNDQITVSPNERVFLNFRLKSLKRGPAKVGPIELCVTSFWQIWQSYWIVNDIIQVKTYPDFERLKQHESLKGVSNLSINGLKLMKKRGGGIEFHQLREFRQGDSIRQIDWQATSKRQKLIAKEYQEERNQHVIVMLDAGSRMNVETQIGSHFDAALNALLMLSHTVLKQGDWFSMQSFNQKERWLPAIKGAQNVSKVMNHFYDLEPDEGASDYLQAVTNLLSKRSKRALILLVTTINDQSFDDLLPALKRLQQHHLVALINIENVALTETLAANITNISEANRYCAAIDLKNNYGGNLKRLAKEGVICVNCEPQNLLPYVINTYLNVKHSGML
ncbi:MAG: DUF58 domain-containing protein [Alteromonadaceae bacterium]|nr:DUF58 domain-containing protein [Alteromonadaceae bacterium]